MSNNERKGKGIYIWYVKTGMEPEETLYFTRRVPDGFRFKPEGFFNDQNGTRRKIRRIPERTRWEAEVYQNKTRGKTQIFARPEMPATGGQASLLASISLMLIHKLALNGKDKTQDMAAPLKRRSMS